MWSIRTKESNGSAPTAASRPRVTAFLLRIHQWRDLSEALIRKSPHFPRQVSPTAGSEAGRAGHLPPADPGESQKGEERRAEQSRGMTTLSSAGSQIYCHCDCPLVSWAAAVLETYAWSFPWLHPFNTSSGNRFPTFIPFVHIGDQGETDQKKFVFLSYSSFLSYFLGFNWA